MNFARRPPPGAFHPEPSPEPARLDSGMRGPAPDADYEISETNVFTPTFGEIFVARTQRAWSALDVYIDGSATTFNTTADFISVGIYAIARGVRTLVSTGRYRAPGPLVGEPMRVAFTRLPLAEGFEVTIGFDFTGPAIANNPVRVVLIASNNAMPAGAGSEDSFGVMGMAFGNQLQSATFITISSGIPFQLVGLDATSTVALRWLHVHKVLPAAIAGRAPELSFGLPSIGSTVFGTEATLMGLRRLFFNGIITLAVSTNGATTVLGAAGDVAYMGYVR